MFRLLKFGAALMITILFSFSQSVFAQAIPEEEFQEMEVMDLRKLLENAVLFEALVEASSAINSIYNCGRHTETASKHQQIMDDIKETVEFRFSDKATPKEAEQFELSRNENQIALSNYKSCFARELLKYNVLVEENITTYEVHSSMFNQKQTGYTNVPNMANYIAAIKRGIGATNLRTDFNIVARVLNTYKTVQVSPSGYRSRWLNIRQGYNLSPADWVRTGPRGRARIIFMDQYKTDLQPLIINVGSNTEFNIGKAATPSQSKTIFQLLKGAVRAFLKPSRNVQIRMGDTIAGIRGTEASFSYNPDADVIEMDLDHGDGYIIHNDQEIQLEPGTSRIIAFGNLSPARALSQERWSALVADTGDGYAETEETVRVATLEVFENQETPTAEAFAQSLVSRMLVSMSRYNESDYSSMIDGPLRVPYLQNTRTKTFREFVDFEGQRPKNWTHNCAVCWKDENNEQICQVQVFVEADNADQNKDLLFWINNMDADDITVKITRASIAQGEELILFQSRNPVCSKQ